MVLLTPGSDNSSFELGAEEIGNWRSNFQTKLAKFHAHGKHIYCWSGSSNTKNKWKRFAKTLLPF